MPGTQRRTPLHVVQAGAYVFTGLHRDDSTVEHQTVEMADGACNVLLDLKIIDEERLFMDFAPDFGVGLRR